MICIVRDGEDYVFATHEDGQTLTGLYGGGSVTGPDGGTATIPAGTAVTVPPEFRFAYDELGRMKDPRQFAGPGSTPVP